MEKSDIRLTKTRKFLYSLTTSAFLVLSIAFFAPLEVYLGNIAEFTFSIQTIWWLLLLFSLLIVLIISFITMWLPDKLFRIVNSLIFAMGICCYIQTNFLNNQMSSLANDSVSYNKNTIIVNLIVWILIICLVMVLPIIMSKLKKAKYIDYLSSFVSGALVLMQAVAFVTLLLSSNIGNYKKAVYLSSEGEYELSSGSNTIVFIIDTCDDEKYTEPIWERHPDLFENLKGFTYYPNATSTYSRTFPSVPYLLTKEKFYFDEPYYQYIDKAYETSDYLQDLKETNTDIRVFTDDHYISTNSSEYFSNVKTQENSFKNTNVVNVYKKMLKIAAYRDAPYIVKNRFVYTANEINKSVLNVNDRAIQENDSYFEQILEDKGLSETSNYSSAYRFYHFTGVHVGTMWSHGETYETDPTPEEALIQNIQIINNYIKQMQELGIYKDSTIIITADHGISEGNHIDLELHNTARPILMVKSAGKDENDGFEISNAPVCHDDLFPTVLASLNGDSKEYGQIIEDVSEDDVRERYYYRTAYYEDDLGEIELQEYLIDGDAQEFKNWKFTGKTWDIKYSERAVNKQ